MRILHICGYTVNRGGAPKVAFDQATFQISKGHDVTILSVDFKNEEPYPLPDKAKLVLVEDHFLGRFIPDFSMGFIPYLKKHQDDFDIIQIHGIWFWGSVAPFFSGSNAKKVYTIHGMLSDWTMAKGRWKKMIFGNLLQNKCLKQADAIIVLTQKEKQELLNYIAIPDQKIHIIANAVLKIDPIAWNEKEALYQDLNLSKETKKVLFLSRINPKKGLDLLIKAFAKLTIPNKELLIAGPDDGIQADLENLVSTLNIQDQVRFLGKVSGRKKEVLFSISNVYALTSHSEGFPMAVLEALEVGVPVLVSDQTRIDDFLLKYDAGTVVSLNEDEITAALTEVLEYKALAERHIKNGYQMLEKEFTPEHIYGQTLDLYAELLKK